jgi:anti-sigma factor RsiW
MPLSDLPPERCLRAREQISLRLDSELSESEELVLWAHLAVCEPCFALSTELESMTAMLRATPVETPAMEFRAPRRRRRVAVHPAAAAVAVAIAAFMIGGFVDLDSSAYHRATVDLRSSRELMSVKERQLQALEGAGAEQKSAHSRTVTRPSGVDPGAGIPSSPVVRVTPIGRPGRGGF